MPWRDRMPELAATFSLAPRLPRLSFLRTLLSPFEGCETKLVDAHIHSFSAKRDALSFQSQALFNR